MTLKPLEIRKIETTLNQHYECEVKYTNDRATIYRIKRKLLYKVKTSKDIETLIESVIEMLGSDNSTKIEIKRENDKLAVIFVKRVEAN